MSTVFVRVAEINAKLNSNYSGNNDFLIKRTIVNNYGSQLDQSYLTKYSDTDFVIEDDIVPITIETIKITGEVGVLDGAQKGGSVTLTEQGNPSNTITTTRRDSINIPKGSSYYREAIPDSGYTFERWNDGVTNPSDIIQTYISRTNTAYFKAIQVDPDPPTPTEYTITIIADSDNGTVGFTSSAGYNTASKTVVENTSVTIYAVSESNCRFVKWIDENGNTISTSSTYTFTARAGVTYYAVFEDIIVEPDPVTMVNIKVNNSTGGSATIVEDANQTNTKTTRTYTGDKITVPVGGSVSIMATPDSGYEFIGWSGDSNSTARNVLRIPINSSATFIANFNKIEIVEPTYYNVIVNFDSGISCVYVNGQQITVSGTVIQVEANSTITWYSVFESGYESLSGTSGSQEVTINNFVIDAKSKLKEYQVTLYLGDNCKSGYYSIYNDIDSSHNVTNAILTNSGVTVTVFHFSTITYHEVAKDGYCFGKDEYVTAYEYYSPFTTNYQGIESTFKGINAQLETFDPQNFTLVFSYENNSMDTIDWIIINDVDLTLQWKIDGKTYTSRWMGNNLNTTTHIFTGVEIPFNILSNVSGENQIPYGQEISITNIYFNNAKVPDNYGTYGGYPIIITPRPMLPFIIQKNTTSVDIQGSGNSALLLSIQT